jgi:signal transduction histidine kinase/CheY-like chemotaxis protein
MVASAVILCANLAVFLAQRLNLQALQKQPALINVAGRQRMLSQRLTALKLAPETCVVQYKPEYLLTELVTTHQRVFGNSSEPQERFAALSASLESLVSAVSSNNTLPCELLRISSSYLSIMETAVGSLVLQQQAAVRQSKRLTLITALMSGIFQIATLIVYGVVMRRSRDQTIAQQADFSHYLFHEVRNPLNHVLNGIEYLTEMQADRIHEEVLQELVMCQKGCAAIRDVLNCALDIGKLERSRQGVNDGAKPTSMLSLCGDCSGLAAVSAKMKGVTVDFVHNLHQDSLHHVNDVRLMQVLINLLSNAVAYTTEGSITLDIASVSQNSTKDAVCFRVIDTGTGISKEQQLEVFKKFKTFSRASGTGLGLYLASLIVRHLGSNLQLLSPYKDGKGSCFYFTLLLNRVHLSHQSLTQTVQLCQQPLELMHLRVLVCDDDTINCRIFIRKVLQSPLKELQWDTHTTYTLADCLRLSQERAFDLIFLDEHFAGFELTGSQYITKLRENGVVCPVLIASANCSAADCKLYISRGAAGMVPKPTPHPSEIMAIVVSALALSRRQEFSEPA